MRAVHLLTALLVIAGGSLASGQHAGNHPGREIEFEEMGFRDVIWLRDSVRIYRDSASWNEHFVPKWPASLGPPPRPDFSDSLVIGLGYGMTLCYVTGGEITSITASDTTVTVHLGHGYALRPVCLADMPRSFFYLVATADLPPDVEFTFDPSRPPYEDLQPREWYPLQVGNAWHFQTRYPERGERVEFVEATVYHEQQTWSRVITAYCSVDPCDQPDVRHLKWTDDHYLLLADASFERVDTVFATQPRSIFTVNVPSDTLTMRNEQVFAGIYKYVGCPFFHERILAAESSEQNAWFVYGVGPFAEPYIPLLGAVIGGEHHGDTALIITVLSAPPSVNLPHRIAIDVYPHPSTENTVLSFTPTQTGVVRIAVFDVLGRSVLNGTEEVTAGADWQIPLSSAGTLAPGLYLVRVVQSGGLTAERTMIVVE